MYRPALRFALILSLIYDCSAVAAYTAAPRWGQASVLVEDILYIQGGRTDLYNQYSYSSAPPTNDMLALSLTTSFNLSSPSWSLISGCSNCSSSQGPAVAWHTLSPLNTTSMLLFGGDLGPNSAITVPEAANSAGLVNVAHALSPIWDDESESWADESLRRMYHSASATGGKVYIVGGEKTDGSGDAFSIHYVFDPSIPSFSALPSTNGPPGIYGHASVVLSNGRLLVFGGYEELSGTLLPFSTVWSLDTTQSSPSWSLLPVADTSLPTPRRGFAATLVDGGKVVIQGGADAQLETSYSDGWVLDTTTSPMVWTQVAALSELGPRRDHFAVGLGTQVLFGFGYETNGPAPASLHVFDVTSGSWSPGYTPPPAVTSPTVTTLSGPEPSYTPGGGESSGTGSSPGGPGSSPNPTGSGSGSGGSGSGSGDGSGSGASGASSSSNHHATSIVLGTVFGVLGLLVGTSAVVWYIRRQHSRQSFHMLRPSDDDDNLPALPIAGSREKGLPPVIHNVRSKLGAFVPGLAPAAVPPPQRRDMLADEDTREFAWQATVRRETSSGRSSWTTMRRSALSDMVHDSLTSLRTVGGTVLAYAAGARSMLSREGSAASRSSAWWEKERGYEPYADEAALMGDRSRATRPRGGRQPSDGPSLDDPLGDDSIEAFALPAEYLADVDADADTPERGPPSLADAPPRPYAHIRAPAATTDLTRLSPVSERPTLPTLSSPPSSDSSLPRSMLFLPATSNLNSASGPSRSSHETPRSPRPSSFLDANPPPAEPIRRSNSWWVRFAKTPLLDRRSSDARPPLTIRDPNPAPRLAESLVPIEESAASMHAGEASGGSRHRRRRDVYASTQHGRSASSLQTARTADSAVLEKMGRTMDVVQKGTVGSHSSAPSVDSADERSPGAAPHADRSLGGRPSPLLPDADDDGGRGLVQSPVQMEGAAPFPSPPTSPRTSPPRRPTTGQVAARVQAFERRMSVQEGGARTKRDRASVYGIAPKSPLFVANPDHRASPSDASSAGT
ncbi:uncharacterized protein FIBRA_05749 [Fibroporia radiculosa]|uniref:Galactose oxidase n=1 Tax=Fibroporia radiculosa TaxID=599839 RepID=J4IAW3_9APHY|nr:uncharacterized protein FIBRA_05749 [Fibroporia radiculosa]CCM03611.1 predicted protein [Fibroporia radiculosa]